MRDDIVITNIDKGGAVIIKDVKDYVKECERHLNNTENQKHLQKDLTATINESVHTITKRSENKKFIQQNIAGLKTNFPRSPRFYN